VRSYVITSSLVRLDTSLGRLVIIIPYVTCLFGNSLRGDLFGSVSRMPFKIILTGGTGRIGSQVLEQCLNDARITEIVCLTRRPLPGPKRSNKLLSIVMDDFAEYPDDVIAKLAGADGCVW
jgi:hypothetical protein